MPKWILRRLGFALIVFTAALVLNFVIPRLLPYDITQLYASESSVYFPEEARLAILKRFGLDQPVMVQFWLYIKNTLTGNFGVSFAYYPKTVATLIADALPRTLAIVLPSLFLYTLIGYLLGVKAGWRATSKSDYSITGIAMMIWSAPMFWVAMVMVFVFGFLLRWFPTGGYKTPGMLASEYSSYFSYIWDLLYHAILPIITLVICRFGQSVWIMRNTMTITLKENYIITAQAKGATESRVKHRHAARNALLPLVTNTGIGFAMSLSGSIFIEKIFSYPGIGKLIFDSVYMADYPVLQGCFFIYSVICIIIVLTLDLIYARLDPRVRF